MTTDHDPRNDIIEAIVSSSMPDGSPIRARAKAEAILEHLGISNPPVFLASLVAGGIRHRARRPHSKGQPSPVSEPEPVPVVEAMPPLQEIAPPRSVPRPVPAGSQPSRSSRQSRRELERRHGPERATLSRSSSTGFPLGETVRITIKERQTR